MKIERVERKIRKISDIEERRFFIIKSRDDLVLIRVSGIIYNITEKGLSVFQIIEVTESESLTIEYVDILEIKYKES